MKSCGKDLVFTIYNILMSFPVMRNFLEIIQEFYKKRFSTRNTSDGVVSEACK